MNVTWEKKGRQNTGLQADALHNIYKGKINTTFGLGKIKRGTQELWK